MRLAPNDMGGAVVRRTFALGSKRLKNGDRLTAEQLLKMPAANRNSLIDNRFIEVWPKMNTGERHVVSKGFGKFDVIEGTVLNDVPLTKEEAEALAAKH